MIVRWCRWENEVYGWDRGRQDVGSEISSQSAGSDVLGQVAGMVDMDTGTIGTNLLKGCSNHLRTFTSTLMTQTGETYVPQFMSLEDYQPILSESTVSGSQSRGSRGGRGARP